MREEWRDVVGYEGWYDVSNFGRVRRMKACKGTYAGRIMAPCQREGYVLSSLHKNGKHSTPSIHRLVAAAFLGPCPAGKEINHIDGVKTHNHVENLEYVTASENQRNAYRMGLRSSRGENNTSSLLSNNDVRIVRGLLGKIPHRVIAGMFGVTRTAITAISTGRTWGWLEGDANGDL